MQVLDETERRDAGQFEVAARTAGRILIGCLSARKHCARRALIRMTWLPDCAPHGIVPRFVMASWDVTSPIEVDDLLILPGSDEYMGLSLRVRDWCRWASAREWDYLFKIDDDTVVSPGRLAAIAAEHLSAGHEFVGAAFPGEIACHGGAGYFLSRRAAAAIADDLLIPTPSEDIEVGRLLRDRGFQLVHEPRFSVDAFPESDNDLATGHSMPTRGPCHALGT